jgi:hypothetical protein
MESVLPCAKQYHSLESHPAPPYYPLSHAMKPSSVKLGRKCCDPNELQTPDVLCFYSFSSHPLTSLNHLQNRLDKSRLRTNFTYYLQTLSVTIGRRCIPPTTGSSSDMAQIDVDLGPSKSVSRLHAKIEYEEEEERFVLVVIGRNGAWVDGVWSPSGNRVSLSERYARSPSRPTPCTFLMSIRSHIQIASRTFQFVLPPPPAPEDSPSPSSHSSANRPQSPSPLDYQIGPNIPR